MGNTDKYQSNLLHKIAYFNKNMKPRIFSKKKEKRDTLDSINEKMVLNPFKSKTFHYN